MTVIMITDKQRVRKTIIHQTPNPIQQKHKKERSTETCKEQEQCESLAPKMRFSVMTVIMFRPFFLPFFLPFFFSFLRRQSSMQKWSCENEADQGL
jgi:hypothetical protein